MQVLSMWRKLVAVRLGVAVFLLAANALAQAPVTAQPKILPGAHYQTFELIGAGCPVAMTARQRGLSQQVETGRTVPAKPAQGLTVTLVGRRALRITSAEIVAQGLSGKSRAVLTSNSLEPDVARTFQLVAKDDGGFSADLWMDGVTSIQRIEVKSLTYSDGSVWHESDTQKCSVKPDPFVLISSAR